MFFIQKNSPLLPDDNALQIFLDRKTLTFTPSPNDTFIRQVPVQAILQVLEGRVSFKKILPYRRCKPRFL